MANDYGNKIKMKMAASFAIVLLLMIAFMAVKNLVNEKIAGNKNQKEYGIELYFIEGSTSLLKSEQRFIQGGSQADILSETLTELKNGPKTEGFLKTVPDNVIFEGVNLDGNEITLAVSPAYYNMKSGEELICRVSIVTTLTSLDFVEYVKMTVNGEEIKKMNGMPIGKMGKDDVVIDGVISPEPTNYETVVLYYANADATALVTEKRQIEVNPNEPIEKYIVEQLIAGPKSSGYLPTIPSETKIRSIRTEKPDGICYVDLSSEFVTKHSGGTTAEIFAIYSIVNSLTELDNIKKVQFLIEGEKQKEFKGHLDFSKPFEAMEITQGSVQ